MSVGDEVINGLVARAVRFQHLNCDRILRELIRLEERDHHLVFCAGVVGKNKYAEIGDADKDEDGKNAFLAGIHAAYDTIFRSGLLREAEKRMMKRISIGNVYVHG